MHRARLASGLRTVDGGSGNGSRSHSVATDAGIGASNGTCGLSTSALSTPGDSGLERRPTLNFLHEPSQVGHRANVHPEKELAVLHVRTDCHIGDGNIIAWEQPPERDMYV